MQISINRFQSFATQAELPYAGANKLASGQESFTEGRDINAKKRLI